MIQRDKEEYDEILEYFNNYLKERDLDKKYKKLTIYFSTEFYKVLNP